MHQTAKEKGGRCLSKKYVMSTIKLKWTCGVKSHKAWLASPKDIRNNRWCPECGLRDRVKARSLTIEQMHDIAESRGGKCLSKKYVNQLTMLKWKCGQGHMWMATGGSVRNKRSWCPKCGQAKGDEARRYTIEMMQSVAEDRGGKCLSKKYIGIHDKLKWKCSVKSHPPWLAVSHAVLNSKTWCPVCGKTQRHTMEMMHKLASDRKGKCLSKVYAAQSGKLNWKCAEGHVFRRTPHSIINGGHWCNMCRKSGW